MKIEFDNEVQRYSCDLASGVSLARPIQFEDSDSNPWNAPAPSATSVTIDDFVGSTRAGGSCNVDRMALIPHCHGTHTETIGHILDGDHFVRDLSIPSLIPAIVISVSPAASASVSEAYQPSLEQADMVITSNAIANALKRCDGFAATAVVIRTRSPDAFFTNEAMAAIVEAGFEHLLVDLPSVDRLNDDGLLSNHRIFWNVELGSKEVASPSRVTHTITELIRVPEEVADGPYLLSIQVPAIDSDAAPSRPVVYSITQI